MKHLTFHALIAHHFKRSGVNRIAWVLLILI